MHSPRSPIYNEYLVSIAVYPPRIFKVLSHVCGRGGHTSEIALLHLSTYIYGHMIALEGDCYPRRPIYGEILARCTRAVYPLDFFGQHCGGGLVCSFGFG
jgi:hypothetical protein